MNIFYLDSNEKVCAQYHVDKHVVKMIVEYAQLLSTAHRVLDGHESVVNYILNDKSRKKKVWTLQDTKLNEEIYKATHINHPSAKWARHCAMNYTWLMSMWLELLDEYTHRYGKHHSCERLIPYLCQLPKNISTAYQFSPPWRAMPDEFKMDKSMPNYCVESYRAYYNGTKTHMFKWKNRDKPAWVKET